MKVDLSKHIKHVAVIPDGNRRWARAHNLPPFAGHKKGFDVAVKIAKKARSLNIHTFTLWAFSTENWNRSKDEVNYLMGLYLRLVDKFKEDLLKEGVRFYHLGRKDRLPKKLLDKLSGLEKETAGNSRFILNVCLDYGGQDEILRAIRKVCHAWKKGEIEIDELSEEEGKYWGKYPYFKFRRFLDTGDQPYPYPDLIIRTSGEQRTSGFLIWQSVYSELYFEKKYFPDFTPRRFERIVLEFLKRDRRFGGN